jgi:hypothetical protein
MLDKSGERGKKLVTLICERQKGGELMIRIKKRKKKKREKE